jgi:hypothetical protein
MRFLITVQIPADAAASEWEPSAEMVAEMMRYNEELTQAGALLALDGLRPPSEGARVEYSGSDRTVTDGPYAEAKEVVGGYWIIQARSRDEAVEWAKRAPFQEGAVEVRPIAEMSDFPEDVQEAAGELSQEPPEQTKATD